MPSKETYSGLSRRDRQYLSVAVELAKTSTCRNKHGALVVVGGSVIATGVNRERNPPGILSDFDLIHGGISYHAEAMALKQLRFTIPNRATIYVARVNRAGIERLSRPCNNCYKLLQQYEIKEVVYTID
jgi:deoxycytidylate deaminase